MSSSFAAFSHHWAATALVMAAFAKGIFYTSNFFLLLPSLSKAKNTHPTTLSTHIRSEKNNFASCHNTNQLDHEGLYPLNPLYNDIQTSKRQKSGREHPTKHEKMMAKTSFCNRARRQMATDEALIAADMHLPPARKVYHVHKVATF